MFLTISKLASADLNGDGYPDIVAGGYYESAQGLYLTEPTETASASANVQVNGVGQHLAQASFPAEGNYESSISSSIPLWGLLPATSTTLSVTSGGSTVTSVTPGTAVLLTAHVIAGANPVTAGQVNFCDASAPHCTDIHILGSAALSSSGTATFKFVPGPGVHSYQAQFVEDGFGLASASNIALLTVGPAPSPVYSDTAAITAGWVARRLQPHGDRDGIWRHGLPTGVVSFVDTSFGNNVLATASLGAGTPVSASWNLCRLRLGPIHSEKSPPTSTAMEYPIWRLSPAITLSEAALTPSQFSSATETEHSGPDRRFNL